MRNIEDTYMDMYGCTQEALTGMMNSPINSISGDYMLVMSILSDAQYVMEHGDNNTARQFINRAKYVMRHWRRNTDTNTNPIN